MGVIANTVLAFSMSADAFAAAISKGAALHKPKLAYAMRIGVIFGSIETITPLIGWLMGALASSAIESIDHWVAFLLLSLIGCKMVYEGLQNRHKDKTRRESYKLHMLVLTAIGTSIDAMAVGVTLAIIGADILLISLMIGTATFVMVTIGVMAGHYLGNKAGKQAEIIAGLCLIAIGAKILFEHLGMLAA